MLYRRLSNLTVCSIFSNLQRRICLFRSPSFHTTLYKVRSVRLRTSVYKCPPMQHDQAYEEERKNLTEEEVEDEDGGKNEIEREAFKNAEEV